MHRNTFFSFRGSLSLALIALLALSSQFWVPHLSSKISVAAETSYQTLPCKRLLRVTFVSSERLNEFHEYWRSQEERFEKFQSNHSVVIAYPHLDEIVLNNITEHNALIPNGVFQHAHPFLHGPLHRYLSRVGTEIFFQGVIVHLPGYFLDNPIVPFCYDNQWPLKYAMYSGSVYSYQMIHMPLLQKYDYYLKMDTDIEFLQDHDVDIGLTMQSAGCLIGHTAIHATTDCSTSNTNALLSFAARENLQPLSINTNWCNPHIRTDKTSYIFYGNFVAYSTKLLLSPTILRLSAYLYEEWEDGYFPHRWTDQASFILYVCMGMNVTYLDNDPAICNWTSWRDSVFQHV